MAVRLSPPAQEKVMMTYDEILEEAERLHGVAFRERIEATMPRKPLPLSFEEMERADVVVEELLSRVRK